MKNNNLKLLFILCLSFSLIVLTTCKKLEKSMMVLTGEVTNISTNSANATGMVIDLGSGALQHGHCYAITPNVTIADTKTQLGHPLADDFTSQLSNLEPGTRYYVKAYISNMNEIVYGTEINFITNAITIPVITTTLITSITSTTASSGGNITDDGGTTVTARGICWSTDTNPTITDSKTSEGIGTGSFMSSLTGLSASTKYFVRAYATNSIGTAYGNQESFTTGQAIVTPTVITGLISDIAATSVTVGGNVTFDGGADVTERGIWFGTTTNAETTGTKLQIGSGVGTFSTSLTGLTAGTLYYLKAYATNSIGTSYGVEITFTTLTTPTLTTTYPTVVTENSAQSGGSITSDGGVSVTERGICWSTFTNPSITDNTTSNGTGVGPFVSNLTGLTANTTYYVRAYATNNVGTAYGNEISFTSLPVNSGTVTDIDLNVYNTVTIGTQTWMRENLKTTRYRDGSIIPNITDNTTWSNQTNGAYCWYNNDQATYDVTYGILYNYYATVDNQNLCPTGWHVPTDDEWTTLTTYLGGENVAGGKMKETGTTHWNSPNEGATNESGFLALPGGCRDDDGYFGGINKYGNWWSSTESTSTGISIRRSLLYYGSNVSRYISNNRYGLSIRCIKD